MFGNHEYFIIYRDAKGCEQHTFLKAKNHIEVEKKFYKNDVISIKAVRGHDFISLVNELKSCLSL